MVQWGWDLINRFNLATLLYLLISWHECHNSYVMVFCVLNELRSEVIVRFVDFVEIVDCINIVFLSLPAPRT